MLEELGNAVANAHIIDARDVERTSLPLKSWDELKVSEPLLRPRLEDILQPGSTGYYAFTKFLEAKHPDTVECKLLLAIDEFKDIGHACKELTDLACVIVDDFLECNPKLRPVLRKLRDDDKVEEKNSDLDHTNHKKKEEIDSDDSKLDSDRRSSDLIPLRITRIQEEPLPHPPKVDDPVTDLEEIALEENNTKAEEEKVTTENTTGKENDTKTDNVETESKKIREKKRLRIIHYFENDCDILEEDAKMEMKRSTIRTLIDEAGSVDAVMILFKQLSADGRKFKSVMDACEAARNLISNFYETNYKEHESELALSKTELTSTKSLTFISELKQKKIRKRLERKQKFHKRYESMNYKFK
jgi:hypothetical protein